MPETALQLILNREQQFAFFAQILTYHFSLTYPRPDVPLIERTSEELQTIEQLQEVAYRVRPWRKNPQVPLVLSFSPEEAGAIKDMITTLQAVYEQWAQHKDTPAALQDLLICQTLIEEAEQRASAEMEGR